MELEGSSGRITAKKDLAPADKISGQSAGLGLDPSAAAGKRNFTEVPMNCVLHPA
jgi:hypothetical protein